MDDMAIENICAGNYIAHVDPDEERVQLLADHLHNTAYLAEKNCPLSELKSLARLILLLHDAGKLREDFQEYMKDILEKGDKAPKRKIDHSSAGGRLIEEIAKNTLTAKVAAYVIYSHHGIQDLIDFESGKSLSEQRGEKEIPYTQIKNRYYELEDKAHIRDLALRAHKDFQALRKNVVTRLQEMLLEDSEYRYGHSDFYLGMFVRILMSLQIDSDWSDSAAFSDHHPLPERMSEDDMMEVWRIARSNFDKYIENLAAFGDDSPLNVQRNAISELCYQASAQSCSRYRLTVPTGAGKTLSSLRFALNHALKYKKRHIIYVSPFNSILLQNSENIRKAVGNPDYVLEHHSDIVFETEEEQVVYQKLTENWDSPIIATTAVQLLNTLFSGKKSSIRRMYNLCDSVIIFDEIQAIPVQCAELFNLAVNFLSEFAGTTVVLCSATQPSLAKRKENDVMPCLEMAGDPGGYAEDFQRVDIEDKTEFIPGGMEIEDLKNFVVDVATNQDTILVIMNTRSSASKVYQVLQEEAKEQNWKCFHLNKNMCNAHIRDELVALKDALKGHKSGEKIICVSTQLIEAGVDLSFSCVIRSLAGMDSIVQAAGRCNRHKELDRGKVYIVKMSQAAEHVERMEEVNQAQKACESFLFKFHQNPESYHFQLDSQEAICRYYELFFAGLEKDKMKYPIRMEETDMTLVDLLGVNEAGKVRYQKCHEASGQTIKKWLPVNQAFYTAGQAFQAIQEQEKVNVIVPYNDEARQRIGSLGASRSVSDQKQLIRELQRYAVGIAPWQLEKLGNAVYKIAGDLALALNEDYYDTKLGITMEAKHNLLLV